MDGGKPRAAPQIPARQRRATFEPRDHPWGYGAAPQIPARCGRATARAGGRDIGDSSVWHAFSVQIGGGDAYPRDPPWAQMWLPVGAPRAPARRKGPRQHRRHARSPRPIDRLRVFDTLYDRTKAQNGNTADQIQGKALATPMDVGLELRTQARRLCYSLGDGRVKLVHYCSVWALTPERSYLVD